MTRALCPPPSLDERIAQQATQVRSYLLRDGRLSLSLMADGGIQIWEPAAAAAAAGGSGAGAAALPAPIAAVVRKTYAAGDAPTRYLAGAADLNGDGRDETLVHVVGPMACGTGGCPTLIFTPDGEGYRLVSTLGLTRPPLRVSPRSNQGWRSLIVEVGGGGGRAGHAEVAYNGSAYPENPTGKAARRITDLTGATVVIPEFASFEDATPLPPQ